MKILDKCPNCGQEIFQLDARYCHNCGHPINVDPTATDPKSYNLNSETFQWCPNCGTLVNVERNYCYHCGRKLTIGKELHDENLS